jgi:hypothetical protein
MVSLSSWRLFGLEIALKKSKIHSDSETGCEPYVRSYATSLITNVIYYKIEHFSLFEDQKTPDDHFSRLSSC